MMRLSMTFVRISAHLGIKVNERAEKCAKETTKTDDTDITAPFNKMEMKTTIQHKLTERWQKQWEEERTGR